MVYHKTLNIVPALCSRTLLLIHSMHSSFHLLTLDPQSTPLPTPSPLTNTSLLCRVLERFTKRRFIQSWLGYPASSFAVPLTWLCKTSPISKRSKCVFKRLIPGNMKKTYRSWWWRLTILWCYSIPPKMTYNSFKNTLPSQ